MSELAAVAEGQVVGNGCQNECPVKVLHDVVAIIVPTGRMSSGGLALPDNLRDKTLTGKVVAVGPGRYPDNISIQNPSMDVIVDRFPMSVQIGDTVCFPNLVGLDVEVDGVKYHMVHEGDILAVIPGK